jgi:hypothetical protein
VEKIADKLAWLDSLDEAARARRAPPSGKVGATEAGRGDPQPTPDRPATTLSGPAGGRAAWRGRPCRCASSLALWLNSQA